MTSHCRQCGGVRGPVVLDALASADWPCFCDAEQVALDAGVDLAQLRRALEEALR